jgi:hypothetical protein
MGTGMDQKQNKKTIQNITSGMQVIFFKFGLAGIWKNLGS